MKKLLIVFTLISGLMAVPVSAGDSKKPDFSDGLASYIKGDHIAALRVWAPLAKQGDRDAQYHIGRMYQTGSGVKVNQEKAFQWYSRAAHNGHATAGYKVKHWKIEKQKVAHSAF